MELAVFMGLTVLAALAGMVNGLSQRDRAEGRAGMGAAVFSGVLSGVLLFWGLAGALFLAFYVLSSL